MRKQRQLIHQDCTLCRADFIKRRHWQNYCSSKCRKNDWEKKHPRREISIAIAFLTILAIPCQAFSVPTEGFATYYTVKSCQREGTSGVWTASGERYDERSLTCALPHHRFGKTYKVTSLTTGRSVVVRHTDFGPGRGSQRRGNIIDLTPKAFSELNNGNLKDGRIAVSVEAL